MSDIKDLKEVVEGIILFYETYKKVMADKKISLGDLQYVPAMVGGLYSAVEGIDNVKDQYMNMTEEQEKELNEFVIDRFDIPEDDVEDFIEEAFALFLNMRNLFDKMEALSK